MSSSRIMTSRNRADNDDLKIHNAHSERSERIVTGFRADSNHGMNLKNIAENSNEVDVLKEEIKGLKTQNELEKLRLENENLKKDSEIEKLKSEMKYIQKDTDGLYNNENLSWSYYEQAINYFSYGYIYKRTPR